LAVFHFKSDRNGAIYRKKFLA